MKALTSTPKLLSPHPGKWQRHAGLYQYDDFHFTVGLPASESSVRLSALRQAVLAEACEDLDGTPYGFTLLADSPIIEVFTFQGGPSYFASHQGMYRDYARLTLRAFCLGLFDYIAAASSTRLTCGFGDINSIRGKCLVFTQERPPSFKEFLGLLAYVKGLKNPRELQFLHGSAVGMSGWRHATL
jgi:hypothetical protein